MSICFHLNMLALTEHRCMGLLDQITSQVANALGSTPGQHDGLVNSILGMLNEGGTGGLAKQFQGKGLGDVVGSWISTGKSLPISASQIQSVLGTERLQQLAAGAGVPLQEIGAKLATVLPYVVDKLTPDGQMPQGGLLEKGMDFLKKQFWLQEATDGNGTKPALPLVRPAWARTRRCKSSGGNLVVGTPREPQGDVARGGRIFSGWRGGSWLRRPRTAPPGRPGGLPGPG